VYYEPSGPSKKNYNKQLRNALEGVGNTFFPVFVGSPTTTNGVELIINFYFKRPRIDYRHNSMSTIMVEHPHRYPSYR
jgi:hypothetical protein